MYKSDSYIFFLRNSVITLIIKTNLHIYNNSQIYFEITSITITNTYTHLYTLILFLFINAHVYFKTVFTLNYFIILMESDVIIYITGINIIRLIYLLLCLLIFIRQYSSVNIAVFRQDFSILLIQNDPQEMQIVNNKIYKIR